LRSRIIAIPQDAFFLPDGNSYRANLDPYGTASTAECENVLKEVELWSLVENRGGLDESMKADSLSQGQKQLFSVARAVLRARARAKVLPSRAFKNEGGLSKSGGILLMDEVTSSVDHATDVLIQHIIHREFKEYTVIAVAHRENTVQDFDRMIVMENGSIKEDRHL
jgi:ABC-type multidrug transport system fused ATPase/permease subunit